MISRVVCVAKGTVEVHLDLDKKTPVPKRLYQSPYVKRGRMQMKPSYSNG